MSKITVAFIRAAMIYFVLAMLLGIRMSWTGAAYPSIPMHVHFNLLGWMSMMIYGVAYHILPRFSGQPLWSERLSTWHFYLANIGLIGMVFGWLIIGSAGGGGYILYIFSLIEGVSILFFAVNMFKTVKAAPPVPPRPPVRPKPKPPVKAAPAAAAAAETKKTESSAKTEVKSTERSTDKTGTKAGKPAAKAKSKARPTAKKAAKKESKPETSSAASSGATKTEKTSAPKEADTTPPKAEAAAGTESKPVQASAPAAEPGTGEVPKPEDNK